MFSENPTAHSVAEIAATGKLPKHVKAVTAKGRRYYYFQSARGEDVVRVRLPDIGLPQFKYEYEVALAEIENRPKPVWRRPDRSYVYFIGGSDLGAIKIGVAARPKLRLAGIQTGSPIPLKILATVEGCRKLEREYHRRFAAHRLHGEWFERHPDILAEIERLS